MAKRGVMMVDLLVGETLGLEIAAVHHALREGLDTAKISLTLVAKTGRRARFAVQAADTIKVTKPAKQAA